MKKLLSMAVLPLALLACSSSSPDPSNDTASSSSSSSSSSGGATMTDEQYQTAAVQAMHDLLLTDIKAMLAAANELAGAAPTPTDRGWDTTLDAAAIAAMRASWVKARAAYEHSEGALAPLFPLLDSSIDARYDDFLTQLASKGGDPDLFDGAGVTGMHGIERILYSDTIPEYVVKFEATLTGYVPAAFPATAAQAADFKAKLCAKFIADAQEMESQWTPATDINVAIVFQGLISLMNEQLEKVQKAASFEEESRYSQRTMADLRENLAGAKAAYPLFQPWILSKKSPSDPAKDGPSIDAKIQKGFGDLDAAYKAVTGDAIPTPPSTWSSVDPSPADLMTPFGQLYSAVKAATDPANGDSIVAQMSNAAMALGFPEF